MTIDVQRMLESFATVTVPIVILMLRNRDLARKEQARKHEENQKLLEEIKTEREWLPSHGHRERSGPLAAEGITKAPDRGGR